MGEIGSSVIRAKMEYARGLIVLNANGHNAAVSPLPG